MYEVIKMSLSKMVYSSLPVNQKLLQFQTGGQFSLVILGCRWLHFAFLEHLEFLQNSE